jgi:hypothetical protein
MPSEESKDQRFAKEVKSNLIVSQSDTQTVVFVAAVHREPSMNAMRKVPAKRGVPIGGYVYDHGSECYLVNCIDFFSLGYVPASFTVSMPSAGGWRMPVPVPENVLKKLLSHDQRRDLKRFMSLFSGMEAVRFEYVQLTGLS